MSFWPRGIPRTYQHSLSVKILAIVLSISSLATAVLTLGQLGWEYSRDYQNLKSNFALIENGYLEGLSRALWDYNEAQIHAELNGIKQLPGIQAVSIELEQKTLYSLGAADHNNVLVHEFPLTKDGNRLGKLVVRADLNLVLHQVLQKAFVIFLSQFLKTLVVSSLLYFAFQRLLTRHLVRISRELGTIDPKASGHNFVLNRRASPEPDELDVLVRNLNEMKQSLQAAIAAETELNKSLERKVTEKTETILKQRQQLEYSSKMSALGEMAGGVAHEVNNPLASIHLLAEQCQEMLEAGEPLDHGQLKHALGRISVSALRIASIVKALRFFSRTGEKDGFRETPVAAIVADTLELCRSRIQAAGVELRYRGVPRDWKIECNAVQISQVLLNLLNNSVDAIQTRSPKWIEVGVERTETQYRFTVTDSGPGIPEAIRARVMEPFFTTKEIGKGTGLGLSISKGFVDHHHGSFEIDGTHPNTRFIITLPLDQSTKRAKSA